jgi:SlyX protein
MSTDAPTAEERLIDLEIRYAHQSRLVAALDDVVREFAARVEKLERQMSALRESQAEAAPGAAVGSDERPPHY